MSYQPRTQPDHDNPSWPPGIKYIIGNEGAERFSFYGMKAILYVYLTFLIQETGVVEKAAEAEATHHVHLFVAGVYALPLLGAILADKLLGKYKTIMLLSLVYCLGHALMAIFDGNLDGTYAGLVCIAIGSGGIKPCVSAHVGDQFGKKNWHLIERVFQAFYFIINFGSFFATLLIPVLYNSAYLKEHGVNAAIAFGVPGVLMFIATFAFWLGRKDFVHIQAAPGGKLGWLDTAVGFLLFIPLAMFLFAGGFGLDNIPTRIAIGAAGVVAALIVFYYRQGIEEDDGFLAVVVYSVRSLFRKRTGAQVEGGAGLQREADADDIATHWFFGPAAAKFGNEAAEGPRAVFRIVTVFFLVSFFWMLFDQHASTWVEQAKQMDREFLWWNLYPSQISSLNPMLVMIMIPILAFVVIPVVERMGIRVTPLRKMSVGMLFAGTGFVAVALIQARIESVGEGQVAIAWQLIPYILMTASEVLVSITGLEFAYTQAPKRMKSIVMGFWLVFIAMGNWLTAQLSIFWKDWNLSEAFWGFAVLMFIAGVLFSLIAAFFYKYRDYPQ